MTTLNTHSNTGLTIGLVYDLRDDYLAQGYTDEQVAEFDSAATIEAIEQALDGLGHRPVRIGHARSLAEKLVKGKRWDLVFNIAEGLHGRSREAQVPSLLELYQIPYTFSDPLVCALTLDKAMTKRLIQHAGLATARFRVVTQSSELGDIDLTYPLFAKPLAEGTGKGVDHLSRLNHPGQLDQVVTSLLQRFRQPVLVEEYLPGREFTTAILGTGSDAAVLGTLEFAIAPDAPAQDYSYEVKEQCESYVHYFPMPTGPLRQEVEALALASYRTLECRDTGRVDIRLDHNGRPCFIEINPLPGLHPTHSDLPMIATQEGLAYEILIDRIITSACTRYPEALCSTLSKAC